MEEIEQVGTGTGFAEALFEGFAGFACAVRWCVSQTSINIALEISMPSNGTTHSGLGCC